MHAVIHRSRCSTFGVWKGGSTSQRKAPDENKDVWNCRNSRQGKDFLTCVKCTTDCFQFAWPGPNFQGRTILPKKWVLGDHFSYENFGLEDPNFQDQNSGDRPLLSSYAPMGWENSPLTLHGTHFQQGSLYPSLGEQFPAECRDYCKLVNGWVWFESRMCRGWL